jgi:hypothetical protein
MMRMLATTVIQKTTRARAKKLFSRNRENVAGDSIFCAVSRFLKPVNNPQLTDPTATMNRDVTIITSHNAVVRSDGVRGCEKTQLKTAAMIARKKLLALSNRFAVSLSACHMNSTWMASASRSLRGTARLAVLMSSVELMPRKPMAFTSFAIPARRVVHVGRTLRGHNGLKQRLVNHLRGQSSFVQAHLKGKASRLRDEYTFQYLEVPDDRKRALLECLAIASYCPEHLGLGASKTTTR